VKFSARHAFPVIASQTSMDHQIGPCYISNKLEGNVRGLPVLCHG